MIFVTVGTHTDGFTRLIMTMDELAGRVEEEVVIQKGSSKYIPRFAKSFAFATNQEIHELMRSARIVVVQAGAGSLIEVLALGKKMIVVPRLSRFGEHFNDHQLELALVLADKGVVALTEDINVDLMLQALEKVEMAPAFTGEWRQLTNALRSQIKIWAQERERR